LNWKALEEDVFVSFTRIRGITAEELRQQQMIENAERGLGEEASTGRDPVRRRRMDLES
jgi:hypothetical protein